MIGNLRAPCRRASSLLLIARQKPQRRYAHRIFLHATHKRHGERRRKESFHLFSSSSRRLPTPLCPRETRTRPRRALLLGSAPFLRCCRHQTAETTEFAQTPPRTKNS